MRSRKLALTVSESSLHWPLRLLRTEPGTTHLTPTRKLRVGAEDLSLQSCPEARGLWQTLTCSDRFGGGIPEKGQLLPPPSCCVTWSLCV